MGNLIDRLGGYEVVKQAISNYKQSGDIVTAAGLELQCLEYRRKNKFYEVGDPVIRKWNNQLYYICHDIDNGGEYLLGKEPNTPFNKCKVCELPSNLSHATKIEVELGYRSRSGQMELFDE